MTDLDRARRWATGVSSKAIFGVMTGKPPADGFCYPHDAGDFERCFALLLAVPEWRARLPEMKIVGPEWSALVDHWSELEALHESADSAAVYRRMKALLDPIEATNPALLKLRGGGTVHFGRGVRRR